jgi:hypothetical protein
MRRKSAPTKRASLVALNDDESGDLMTKIVEMKRILLLDAGTKDDGIDDDDDEEEEEEEELKKEEENQARGAVVVATEKSTYTLVMEKAILRGRTDKASCAEDDVELHAWENSSEGDTYCGFAGEGKCRAFTADQVREVKEHPEDESLRKKFGRLYKIPKDYIRLREEEMDELEVKKTKEERREIRKALARKRACRSCYNWLYRSLRMEIRVFAENNNAIDERGNTSGEAGDSVRKKPSVKEKVFAPKRTYFCSTCNLECSSRYHLRTHERTHTGDRPYLCNVCGRRFNRPYEWKVHVLKHAENGRHQEVAKAFERNIQLGMNTVNGVANPALKRAGEFIPSPPRKRKSSTSTGTKEPKVEAEIARPYKCHLCSSAFAKIGVLRSHLTTHDVTRPRFSCDMCDASYTRKFKLKVHMEKRHGVKMNAADDEQNYFKTEEREEKDGGGVPTSES